MEIIKNNLISREIFYLDEKLGKIQNLFKKNLCTTLFQHVSIDAFLNLHS